MKTDDPFDEPYVNNGKALAILLATVLLLWGCAALAVLYAVFQWLRVYG